MHLGESFVELSVASMLTKNSTSNPAVQNWRIIAPFLIPVKRSARDKSAKKEQANPMTLLGGVGQCGQILRSQTAVRHGGVSGATG
jgi:hypothetical protein